MLSKNVYAISLADEVNYSKENQCYFIGEEILSSIDFDLDSAIDRVEKMFLDNLNLVDYYTIRTLKFDENSNGYVSLDNSLFICYYKNNELYIVPQNSSL